MASLLCTAWLAGATLAPSLEAAETVREERYVTLGDIEQWITIRGKDRTAPVLLWLHGGPADIQSPLESVYEPWTNQYTLVQWDQRGAGRTFQRNPGPPESVTLDRIAQDGIELAEYLRKRLNASKIILAGHSWGSLVAITMGRARPELFERVIGAGQVSSWRETVSWQYEYVLLKAREAADDAVVTELETSGVPPHDDFAKYSIMRRRLTMYFPQADRDWLQRQASLYASAVTPETLKSFSAGGTFSFPKLLPDIIATNLSATVPTLGIPFCVIQGSDDTFTPGDPARAFFERIEAPSKKFQMIEGAGHFAAMTHTKEFLNALAACRE